ncbi:hypothetical protein GCM10022234_22680 [Aeromicrobium panaciterrae]
MASLSAAGPVAQFDLGDLDRHNPNNQQFPEQVRWLTVGSSVGLAFGLLALTATAIGASRERRSRMRTLRLIGAGHAHLLPVHFWATASPIIVLGWLATGAGWLVTLAIRNVDDRATVSFGVIGLTAVVVTSAGILVAILTYPDAVSEAEC